MRIPAWCWMAAVLVALSSATVAKEPPPVTTDNSNGVLKEYAGKLKLSASSYWPGWPVGHAFDGNPQTSWFTERGDAAAHGTEPWLEVEFPTDVRIRRVTVLGNRDPAWLKGYTILGGRVEIYNRAGKLLFKQDDDGRGPASDFDFRLKAPLDGARRIRFWALGDEGRKNIYDDVAVGEVQVE